MNVDVRQIRAFLAVARLESFTKAAQALNLSQPALTVQIRNLEEGLGLKLIDRNTRTVGLTRMGRELLPALQRIMGDLEAVLSEARDLAGGNHGIVRLAALPSQASGFLPEVIARFREANPRMSFVINDTVASGVLRQVREEAVDLGLTGGRAFDEDIEILHVSQDRMHVVYPHGHPLAEAKQITAGALSQHPLVLMHPSTSVRTVVDAAFAASGVSVVIAAEPTYMSTAVGMVRAGLGVAILPGSAMEVRAETGLSSRPIEDGAFMRDVSLIKRAGRTLPPVSESFARVLIQAMRAELAKTGPAPMRGAHVGQ